MYPTLAFALNLTTITALSISAVTDITERKIYNVITFPLALAGLTYHAYVSGWAGVQLASLGLTAGLLLFLPLYLKGVMGAGDVKLLAAIGAIKGWQSCFDIGLYSILFGGILGVGILLINGRLRSTCTGVWLTIVNLLFPLRHSKPGEEAKHLPKVADCLMSPFGPAILAATLAYSMGYLSSFLAGF